MSESNNVIHPVDEYVGSRVRLKRLEKNLTQHQLAKNIGITFQQIQKYEKGVNRISSSKLFEIANALKVPVTYFFDGMPNSKYEYKSNDNYVALLDSAKNEYNVDSDKETAQLHDLIKAFMEIREEDAKANLVKIAQNLANKGSDASK